MAGQKRCALFEANIPYLYYVLLLQFSHSSLVLQIFAGGDRYVGYFKNNRYSIYHIAICD